LQITISDDGRGIDKTKVLTNAIERGLLTADDASRMCDRDIYGLIFRPNAQIAAVKEQPVRVVGIDHVAAALRHLGGLIEVQTTIGVDGHFVVTIPLAAVLLRTLLVRAADQTFAVPDRQIVCVAEAEDDEIQCVDGRAYFRYRSVAVPLHPLDRLLGYGDGGVRRDRWRIVILSTGTHLIGVVIDDVLRLEDLYLRELHPMLAALPAVAGTAVLGNGRVALVLDAKGLLELSRSPQERQSSSTSAGS
jgi:two-component system, chemotaxis family, sensor kinase CheA